MPRAASKVSSDPWTSKIVGYGVADVDAIVLNPRNWRGHPPSQMASLLGVLADVGIIQNLIINQRTGPLWPVELRGQSMLVDGHARVVLAQEHGQQTLPVTYVELTPQEEAKALVTYDYVASLFEAQKDRLNGLLHEVQSGDSRVQQLLESLAVEHKLLPGVGAGLGTSFSEGSSYDDGAQAWDDPGDDDAMIETTPLPAPESNVRMVQLFLTTAVYPAFESMIHRLATLYGTTTMTDTVLECVTRATHALPHPS